MRGPAKIMASALSFAMFSACFLPQGAHAAEEGVFLATEDARRLVGELYAGRECAEQLSLCDSQRQNAEERARILEEGVRAGEADIVALRAEADALGGHLKDVAADLSECEASKPSRVKWFAAGGITGVLAIVLAGMALK